MYALDNMGKLYKIYKDKKKKRFRMNISSNKLKIMVV